MLGFVKHFMNEISMESGFETGDRWFTKIKNLESETDFFLCGHMYCAAQSADAVSANL